MKKRTFKLYTLKQITAAFLLSAALVTVVSSCSKIIEQSPQNSPYDQVFWQSEKDANQALAGDYALLRKALTVYNDKDWQDGNMSHFAYGDLSTGEFSEFNHYAYNFLVQGGHNFGIADFTGDYISSFQDWTPHYKTITQSNTILEKVPNISADKFKDPSGRNKIIGEALFLRAFSYFYMVRIWGDVPLITKYDPQPGNSVNIPNTSELVVLDTCINDLKRAISLLPWGYENPGEAGVRANAGAANALLAHVYMWKDFLTKGAESSNLQNAISAIEEVISKGGYSLLPSTEYARLFKGKSEEGIFEIGMSFEQNEQQQETGFYYITLIDPYIKGKTEKWGILDGNRINDYFEETDKRREAFFDFTDPDDPILVKYCGGNKENVVYKDAANFSQTAVNSNIIIFRLADILLLRAEANAKMGNYAAARTDLDEIRATKGGLEPYAGTDEELYDEIISERARELFCEGHLWYDLVRSGSLTWRVEGFSEDRYANEGWKWPISRKLFLNNNVLVQNKFWQGKVR
jgi:hypothetical protein